MRKGKLIVLDGTDGSGKGTHSKILVQRLKKEGYNVAYIDFPQYGNYSAAFVERYLRGEYGTAKEVDAYTASLFYAIDRFAAKKKLEKWLSDGKIIIANRYVSASQIHQAGKIEKTKDLNTYLQWLDDLEYIKFGIPKPDLVLFLNVPAILNQKLVDLKSQRSYLAKGQKRDIHEADLEHLQNAYKRACSLVKKYPYWKEIVMTKKGEILPRDINAQTIWKEVQKLLPKKVS